MVTHWRVLFLLGPKYEIPFVAIVCSDQEEGSIWSTILLCESQNTAQYMLSVKWNKSVPMDANMYHDVHLPLHTTPATPRESELLLDVCAQSWILASSPRQRTLYMTRVSEPERLG